MTTARPARRSVAAATAFLTAVLTAAVLPIGTGVAHAATPQQTQFYVNDTNNDGYYGLGKLRDANGNPEIVVAESTSLDVESVVGSADGTRFADVETTLDSFGDPVRTAIVVRDISGRAVQTVENLSAATGFIFSVALSPNGSTVVWGRFNFATDTIQMARANIGSAGAVVGTDLVPSVFLNASTVLADSPSGYVTVSPNGGTTTAFTGIPAAAYDLAMSADGGSLAWALDTTGDGADTADIQVSGVSNGATGWQLTAATTVATGLNNHSPSFSGSTVIFVKDDGDLGDGATWQAPANGSNTAGSTWGPGRGDIISQAMGMTDDGTAPGDATWQPATLNGTSATLRWSLPTDADLSGVLIKRTLGETLQSTTFVAAPVSSRVDTGLAIGSTYSYSIQSVDRSGNLGALSLRNLTALQAKPTASDPTSTTATRAPFKVTFGPSSPAGAAWTVEYRSSRNHAFRAWVNGVEGGSRTFGSAATTGVDATTSELATTYQFRAIAADAFGNTTPLVYSNLAVVPYDQTRATFAGGANVSSAAAWLGSYRVLNSSAQGAQLAVTGNQFKLVGWRCNKCGVFDIYEGGTRLAAVDTYAGVVQPRAVLYTRTWGTGAASTHTITIKPRGTAGRPSVIIDGFAVRAPV